MYSTSGGFPSGSGRSSSVHDLSDGTMGPITASSSCQRSGDGAKEQMSSDERGEAMHASSREASSAALHTRERCLRLRKPRTDRLRWAGSNFTLIPLRHSSVVISASARMTFGSDISSELRVSLGSRCCSPSAAAQRGPRS